MVARNPTSEDSDAFGRLRKVTVITGGRGMVSEYRYNGLGMKIGWHYDADEDNDTDSNDPWYYTCFNERWQSITTFRGSDSAAKESYIYHSAGPNGMGGGSYIDDVLRRDKDADGGGGWTGTANGKEEIRYFLQNWRHDVVMILSDTGKLVENIKYLSYGAPIACPAGDYRFSGAWDSAASTAIGGYGGAYDVRYDANLDGGIDSDDVTWANSIKSGYQTLGFGVLSSTAVFNRKGYAGYELAPELAGSKYHVRNRVLDAELGRWTRRDPLGYVDGMGLYACSHSNPLTSLDPWGKCATDSCGSAAPTSLSPSGASTPTDPTTVGVCMWDCYRAFYRRYDQAFALLLINLRNCAQAPDPELCALTRWEDFRAEILNASYDLYQCYRHCGAVPPNQSSDPTVPCSTTTTSFPDCYYCCLERHRRESVDCIGTLRRELRDCDGSEEWGETPYECKVRAYQDYDMCAAGAGRSLDQCMNDCGRPRPAAPHRHKTAVE